MKVFSEIQLGNVSIKNKIVRSATHSMLGNLDGTISEAELEMFEEFAANEVGMIIAGQFFVSKKGIAAPGSNELSENFHIDGVNRILARIRPYGTKVIAQINHGGAKAYSEDKISASAIVL